MIPVSPQTQLDPAAVLTKAFLRAGHQLGLSQRELAQVIGVSEATVSRLSAGRNLFPETKQGEFARLFLRLFRSLDAILGGDVEQCRRWFSAPNHHLNGTPRELVRNATGLVHVLDYLDALRGKL